MFDKMAFAVYSAYLSAKAKVMKLGKEEDGMETLETVILIAIAVIIAGILVNVLTKDFNGTGKGMIAYMFDEIGKKLKNIFEVEGQVGG